MRHQIIENAPKLTNGQKWEIMNLFFTARLFTEKRTYNFNDVDRAIWKQQEGIYHLFEMHRDGFIFMAYCIVLN
jgi:hypothetical protein